MDKDAKRDARLQLKERKADAGIYALHLGGAVWVGQTQTLASIENRIRFTLRQGGLAPAELTAAWVQAGGEGLRFEVLERLDPELLPMTRGDLLKSRCAIWRTELGAGAI